MVSLVRGPVAAYYRAACHIHGGLAANRGRHGPNILCTTCVKGATFAENAQNASEVTTFDARVRLLHGVVEIRASRTLPFITPSRPPSLFGPTCFITGPDRVQVGTRQGAPL
eukprot:SAG22_NODE_4385_length_1281_cov_1.522766_2_plen_112_part_00